MPSNTNNGARKSQVTAPVDGTKANSPQAPGADDAESGAGMPLPHERDQSHSNVGAEPRRVIAQAKRDLDAGMVDTDMRSTPGLDAERRGQLVSPTQGKP